jgi:hypothetical protein
MSVVEQRELDSSSLYEDIVFSEFHEYSSGQYKVGCYGDKWVISALSNGDIELTGKHDGVETNVGDVPDHLAQAATEQVKKLSQVSSSELEDDTEQLLEELGYL